ENKQFNLLEALAENIAEEVLNKFILINGVMVRVRKPEAPVNGIYDYFGVEIRRTRDE
ncbi:dihydroneopterin aldolase, partial [Clostridioides difficile]|uniref:dihydroneopterin aldolase n=2 Tax=Clostridioides TaxID=1870884 RepID=UPI003F8D310B